MTDTFEFTLDHPLTEEQWDMLTDVDLDHTDRIWFNTKHGKEVEFAKVTRCKDCKYFTPRSIYGHGLCDIHCNGIGESEVTSEENFCSWAERKDNG